MEIFMYYEYSKQVLASLRKLKPHDIESFDFVAAARSKFSHRYANKRELYDANCHFVT